MSERMEETAAVTERREPAGAVRAATRDLVGRLRALPRPSPRARHVISLTAIVLAATAVYAQLGLVRFDLYRATSLDLTLFDQVVRGFSHFSAPTSPLRGFTLDKGMDFNQLGEHFSPILAVLAPLYWIYDGPETLIVAQAALFALAIPPLWVFTRRVLGTGPAYLVVVAYALSWPLARAMNFDFHEAAFAPLITAVMIERFSAGRHGHVLTAAAALLLVKEDMGLMVAGFGAYVVTRGRRLDGVTYIAAGVGYTLYARALMIPAVGGDPAMYWAYGQFGPDLPHAVLKAVTDPLNTLGTLISPQVKLDTWAFLLWPTLLLCLLSPLTLMAVPQLLERMLSDRLHWWITDFHHSAFTVVVLLCAGVDGAARLGRLLRRRKEVPERWTALIWATGVCLVAVTLVPRFPLDQLIRPEFYERKPDVAAAEQAVAAVPSGVLVEAVNHVGPHLSARTTTLLWTDKQPAAPWIVADTDRFAYPWGSVDRQRQRVEELMTLGYQVVFAREGYVVLHRPGTAPP
ncbi:hypothetical protein Ssi03_08630 [Sphaerisporangium siamense]|uniref:Putative membrane protein n=1 Tax=Sphaerisporangium siamense TaxID=795645 RepID=A0A7W7DHB2_9ACTN|nr:DUF2079 domain-containing protein [Sphaerisporangium siamense]MBB4705741.1 putative membrane protein [Sphaerisporangium siamense]GII82873.1 hypothetical protein Ssi03_08630 [Sphaerisporangium siamense]